MGCFNLKRGPRRVFLSHRAPGSPFTFTVTADSRLDEHTEPAIYRRTLANALADQPYVHLDPGDRWQVNAVNPVRSLQKLTWPNDRKI